MGMCWKHIFSAVLARASNCGRSYFLKRLLENANGLFSVMHETTVWCYSCWQSLYQKVLCKHPFIKFVEDLLESLSDNHLFPPNKVNMVVMIWWTLLVRVMKLRKLLLSMCITGILASCTLCRFFFFFCQDKKSHTITLNTKYTVLFKNPWDKLQDVSLARQMYPFKAQCFLEAFEDAMKAP